MVAVLHLVDETPSGATTPALTLRLADGRITVGALIRRRVEAEVALHNAAIADADRVWTSLVVPTDAERTLNGWRSRTRRPLDAERQVRVALEAFLRNGFFVLIGDHQVEDLDQEVVLTDDTTVSFLRLMPLVGG